MSRKTLATTIRLTPEVAHQIDLQAAQHGFGTRSKYMTYTALHYAPAEADELMSELARISFALYQIGCASTGDVHLLKPRDIAQIRNRVRAAMDALIASHTT